MKTAMNLLLDLWKALGVVLGAYLLLFAGIWAMVFLRFGAAGLADFGLKNVSPSPASLAGSIFILFVLPILVAFGALSLPSRGRIYAAIGALLLIVGIWVLIGIQIGNAPHD